MKNKLYWGCTIPARLPFVEKSARKVFDKLEIQYSDMENTSCCPDPTGLSSMDITAWLSLGARNLSLIEDKDSVLVSLCSGCVETLKTVDYILKEDPEIKKQINENLAKIGRTYVGGTVIRHAAELLYDNINKIKEKVIKPLKGFKVAVHYGCHYLRPSHIINYDDPQAPITLDQLVEALGAESLDYLFKLDCCGNPVGKTDENISNELTLKKLKNMKNAGANCIVVVCPACFTQFDFQQKTINKIHETDFNLPVFYLTELIALAMGLDPRELGIRFHATKTKQFFEEINFISSKSEDT